MPKVELVDTALRLKAVERVGARHCTKNGTECICDERSKEKKVIMSKAGAEVILKSLIGIEIDVDALPMGGEEAVPAGVETVIFASEMMGRNGRRVADKQFDLVDGLRVKREKEGDDIIVIRDEPED
jgi:DEAD/DEAH box helicase domain-containing protein